GDDVSANADQRRDGQMQRRLATGGCKRPPAPPEGRNARPQGGPPRVGGARGDGAAAPPVEEGRRGGRVVGHAGGGWVAGDRAGDGGRIGALAGVEGERVKAR